MQTISQCAAVPPSSTFDFAFPQAGCVVFDGRPDQLTTDVLTQIYGEEDWSAMQNDAAEDAAFEAETEAQHKQMLEAL